MLFTLLFGSLPIVARFYFAAESTEAIPWILVSDVIFFGLMFNASAVANTIGENNTRWSYVLSLGVTVCLSAALFCVYVMDMAFGPLSAMGWTILLSVLVLSFFAAFFTSNSDNIRTVEKHFDRSHQIAMLPPHIRRLAYSCLSEMQWKNAVEQADTFERIFDQYDWKKMQRRTALILEKDEHGKDTLVLNKEPTAEEELVTMLSAFLEDLQRQRSQQ